MNPVQDLGAIARLIAEAFAGELDARGRAGLREMRWMARLSPLVWWWTQADPAFRESFGGFVWEEPAGKGQRTQIVGNVSLNCAPGADGRWVISNVVVQPEWRGQGIGRRLAEAAIADARQSGALSVILQVYQDNAVALRLYKELGFRHMASETTMQRTAAEPTSLVDAAGYRIRSWHPSDGQALFDLARRVTPPVHQWLRPVRPEEYRFGPLARVRQWIGELVGGRRTYRLVAIREDELVALMTVLASFRRGQRHLGHRIALLVHGEHSGQVEAALVSRALRGLAVAPPGPILATVDTAHEAAARILSGYGFVEQRTLLTLSMDLRSVSQNA